MSSFVRQLDSQKWGNQTYQEDKFVLTIADMDIPLHEPLKKSIVSRISMTNNFTYKNPSEEYYKAIIQWYQTRHIKEAKVNISKEDIADSPSLLNCIYLLIQILTHEDDGVLLMTPVFYNYVKIIKYLKRKVIETRLYNQKVGNTSRYDINYTDFQEKAKLAKVMIICNPHNPTGRIWGRKQVEKIVSICEKYNIFIISDQILCDLTPTKNLNQFYSLVNTSYQQVVVCNSISKAFNAQSLKGGFAIFKNKERCNKYREAINQLNLYTNQFALLCTEVFYSREGVDWLNFALSIIKENYAYLSVKAEGTLLTLSQLESAYIIVISFEGYIKFIERWYHSLKTKEAPAANMVAFFLGKHGIRGVEIPYASQFNGIFADIRFTIAVEPTYFRKFADKLISSLFEVEFQFREIDAKL